MKLIPTTNKEEAKSEAGGILVMLDESSFSGFDGSERIAVQVWSSSLVKLSTVVPSVIV